MTTEKIHAAIRALAVQIISTSGEEQLDPYAAYESLDIDAEIRLSMRQILAAKPRHTRTFPMPEILRGHFTRNELRAVVDGLMEGHPKLRWNIMDEGVNSEGIVINARDSKNFHHWVIKLVR